MKTLPKEFTERMRHSLGSEMFSAFEASLNIPAPTSIRINPAKFTGRLNLEKVDWCDTGYYLPERPLFVADPLWHAGGYYVQEASSMALEAAFKVIKPENKSPLSVLDLCAAPGGKSTHIASLLSGNDILVSNEVIKSRVGVLSENLTKWGYPNQIITNSDSKDFRPCGELFDVVVVDAPCSGEGLFRKDEQAINEWSVANTDLCTMRQKRILDDINHCIKPGGYLVYSTCTYNPEENELQIEALLKHGFVTKNFPFNGEVNAMHQCYPHQIKGEGFFIALLQKVRSAEQTDMKKKSSFLKVLKDDVAFRHFITQPLPFYEFRNNIIALSEPAREMIENLHPQVNCVSAGIKVCEKNDRLLTPSEYLPFSSIFNATAFEIKPVEMNEAVNYLGKQALPYQSGNKGYITIQYHGINLGLGKLAGNRINNLFPNEWRLRKTISANEYFSLENYS